MSYTAWTILIVATLIGSAIAWDIFVFIKTGGKPMAQGDATISHLIITAARKYFTVAVIMGLAIGILCGHLFWPQHLYLCP
jgi:hypothetical protein